MSKVVIFTGGDPFSPSGIGSGTKTCGSISQTIPLVVESRRMKFWFGNPSSGYMVVSSAILTQGTINIPVTFNGQTSSEIQSPGLWSDYITLTGFTFPGSFILTIAILETYIHYTQVQHFSLTGLPQAAFWLAGNGVSTMNVTHATLTQGTKTIPLTVNGHTSFYIPPTGRWSDYASIADFTFPGNVTITVFFADPVDAAIFSDNPVPDDPVVVSVIADSLTGAGLTGEILFDVEFEGTFTDSVNGLTPVVTGDATIETGSRMFGNGCLKLNATTGILQPTNITGVTITEWISGSGITESLNLANVEGVLHLYLGTNYGYDHGAILTEGGSYTIFNESNTIAVNVVFSELPPLSNNNSISDSIGLIQQPSSLTYTPSEETKTILKANGFTYSVFGQIDESPTTHLAYSFEKASGGYNCYLFIAGILQGGVFISDDDIDVYIIYMYALSTEGAAYYDGYQIIKGAVWTSNFTPPSQPFVSSSDYGLLELTSNSSITLTTNPAPGDTIKLKGGTLGDVTLTFVNHYPNNQYEVQIGATVNETAANLALAINKIAGAEFTAAATDNVVDVIAYSPTFSMEETGESVVLGGVTRTLDGLITEDISVDDSFTVADGGKAIQQNVSVTEAIDGLIDGLSENINITDYFDTPMDGLDESVLVSTSFVGLIDVMR